MSLATLGLGAELGDSDMDWSLQKLPGAICKEQNLNRAF